MSEKDSTTAEQAQLALEYARLAQEEKLRVQEIELRRAELDAENAVRKFSWLTSPAMAAIAAGLVGYLSTLYSTYATRHLEASRQEATERLEQEKSQATLQLAREKQEGTLILESIRAGGPKEEKERTTAANLVFLVDAGLVKSLKKEEIERLRAKAGDALPSLPSPNQSPIDLEFRQTPSLTAELREKLQRELTKYQQYLVGVGYDPAVAGRRVGVQVDDSERNNAFFDGEVVNIGKNLAGDAEYAYSELTWFVLKSSNAKAFASLWGNPDSDQLRGFAQSLKFYFSCSYGNDPHVGKNYWALVGMAPPKGRDSRFLFDLTTGRKAAGPDDLKTMEEHELGELWGACLWEIRAKIGQKAADQLVFTTWKKLEPTGDAAKTPKYFVDAIISAADEAGAKLDHDWIRKVFADRNLK